MVGTTVSLPLAFVPGQGLLPGAEVEAMSSIRFTPGHFFLMFSTMPVRSFTHSAAVVCDHWVAWKITRSGAVALAAQACPLSSGVFQAESPGAPHASV